MKSLGLTFKKEKKCEPRKWMLENQNFNDSTLQDDPFVILDQVIVEAAPIFNIINEDDDQINIEWHFYDSLWRFIVSCDSLWRFIVSCNYY